MWTIHSLRAAGRWVKGGKADRSQVFYIPLDSVLQKALDSVAGPSQHAVMRKDVDLMFTIHHYKVDEQQEKSCFYWKEKRVSVKLFLFICIHKSCLSQCVTCQA